MMQACAEALGAGIAREVYPIPPQESLLETVTAELVCEIDRGGNALEGLIFEDADHLLFVSAPDCRLARLDLRTAAVETICVLPTGSHPAGLRIAADGRYYVACLGPDSGGFIAVISPEGAIERLLFDGAGYHIDDVVFDGRGGFFFSDMGGSAQCPTGGVYHVSEPGATVEPVLTNRCMANGIALEPDGHTLWVTEFGAGILYRLRLQDDLATIEPYGTSMPYSFIGCGGCDSCELDAAGNLYVAIFGQGRYLVFAPNGVPRGQIAIPGRDRGRMLMTTHAAMRPGTDEVYVCASDEQSGLSAIYMAHGYTVQPTR